MSSFHKPHDLSFLATGAASGILYVLLAFFIGDLATPFVIAVLLPAVVNAKTTQNRLALACIPPFITLSLGPVVAIQMVFSAIIPSLILGRLSALRISSSEVVDDDHEIAKKETTSELKDHTFYPLSRLVSVLSFYALCLSVVGYIFWHGFGFAAIAQKTLFEDLAPVIQSRSVDSDMSNGTDDFETDSDGVTENETENRERALESSFESPIQAEAHKTNPSVNINAVSQNPLAAALLKIWPFFPGIYAGLLIILFSIGVSLAQKNKLKPYPLFAFSLVRPKLMLSDLYVPWVFWKLFAIVGSITAVSFLIKWPLGLAFFGNISLTLCGLFVLQGMAVITAFAKKQKNPKMFLVVFYVFVVIIGWIILLIVLMGLLEPWLNLRSKLAPLDDKNID